MTAGTFISGIVLLALATPAAAQTAVLTCSALHSESGQPSDQFVIRFDPASPRAEVDHLIRFASGKTKSVTFPASVDTTPSRLTFTFTSHFGAAIVASVDRRTLEIEVPILQRRTWAPCAVGKADTSGNKI